MLSWNEISAAQESVTAVCEKKASGLPRSGMRDRFSSTVEGNRKL